jgi:TnpA family transposase
MASIYETAYPRIKSTPSDEDLIAVYSPSSEELLWAKRHTRQDLSSFVLLVQLKVVQRLGYFLRIRETPEPILRHIASLLEFDGSLEDISAYDTSGSRQRHLKVIRQYLGITPVGDETLTYVRQIASEAAATKEEHADIINIVLERLTERRFELPAFNTVAREALSARATVNQQCFETVNGLLNNETKAAIDKILSTDATGQRSTWDAVKQEPKQPTVTNVRDFIRHLRWLQRLGRHIQKPISIPPAKVKTFVTEARALNVANMNELAPAKRYTLAALLIRAQTSKAFDDIADIVIRIMRKLHNNANEALREHQLNRVGNLDSLVDILRNMVTAHQNPGSKEERFDAIDSVLAGESSAILEQCEAHMAYADNNYISFMLPFYRSKRAVLFNGLEILELRSTTQDQAILEALAFVFHHRRSRKSWLTLPKDTSLDLDWIPEKWQKMVILHDQHTTQVNRRYFELCVFTQVAQDLKSGDLYVVSSDHYADFRDQLVSWEEYKAQVAEYGRLVGIETDPPKLIADLKQWLNNIASATDKAFPDNDQVRIEDGELIIRKNPKKSIPQGLERIESALDEHLPHTNILDALIDTEKWLYLSRSFKPLSGHETKLKDHQERFVATLFCYGCNLGPTQTARSVQGFNRRQLSWLNLRHVTEEKLDEAIVKVVNAYNMFELPKCWGSGSSASADGTKWDVYEQNLLSEYHIRYAGRGGLGYYHLSDTYIALFSHFIPCGVYEAIYILDGLQKNRSDIQPDTLHGDTQSQSEAVFGLAYLLGIKLMPRIRGIKHLKFYRSTKNESYEHIDALFTNTIRWDLIEKYLPDLLRIAVSIKAGRITPSTILRRLGTYSRKNKLYQALRELGRVVRTVFLLQYISEAELRQMIQAATCKSEEFNDFLQWVLFGGEGVIAQNLRHEQRKIIKYNHLVANLLILHNVATMTKTLGQLMHQGYSIDDEIMGKLSPFRKGNFNRFGSYVLNMERGVEPLEYDILRP